METFFALIPAEPLHGFILECKGLAREIAGDQEFLGDAPHLTLSVGCYEDGPGLREAVAACLAGLRNGLSLAGWRTFRDDPVTGGHTLILEPAESDKEGLRRFQETLLAAVSGFRTQPIPDRYQDRSRFSPAMLGCLDRHGYPFVGPVWEPHYTIASFSSSAYDSVRDRLTGLRPPAHAGFAALGLYRAAPAGGFVALRTWGMGQSR